MTAWDAMRHLPGPQCIQEFLADMGRVLIGRVAYASAFDFDPGDLVGAIHVEQELYAICFKAQGYDGACHAMATVIVALWVIARNEPNKCGGEERHGF